MTNLFSQKLDFWVEGFDRMLGTDDNWGKWSDVVAIMLPDIISWEIKLENITSVRVFNEILNISSICNLNKVISPNTSLSIISKTV